MTADWGSLVSPRLDPVGDGGPGVAAGRIGGPGARGRFDRSEVGSAPAASTRWGREWVRPWSMSARAVRSRLRSAAVPSMTAGVRGRRHVRCGSGSCLVEATRPNRRQLRLARPLLLHPTGHADRGRRDDAPRSSPRPWTSPETQAPQRSKASRSHATKTRSGGSDFMTGVEAIFAAAGFLPVQRPTASSCGSS